MAKLELTPTLSPKFATYLRDYLLDQEIDPEPLFSQCGIEKVAESESALPIPTVDVLKLFDRAAGTIGDPLLGHNIGRTYHFESSAVIVLAFLAAPTVGEGLETLSYFDKFVDTGITTSCDFNGSPVSFSAGLLGIDQTTSRHLNEYLITFTFHALLKATRKPMPLREVHFQHERAIDGNELEAYFCAPLKFCRTENKLVFDREYLGQPMYTSNALLFDVLQSALKTYFYAYAPRDGFVDLVCRELMRQSEVQNTDLKFVADALAMSPRTVRRHLQNAGVTFQQVKNLARELQTKYFLANTDKSLAEIAFLLGYSDTTSFGRAFKKWTGKTPQEFRSIARRLFSS